MRIFLSIAWRNVMRNKKRSFITAFAIAIGVTAMIFMWSLFDGLYPMMVENMTSLFMGHMEVNAVAYVEKPLLENAITDGESTLDIIASTPGISSYSPRLTTFGLASYGENSQGTAIIGIDPELEAPLGKIDESVQEGGSFLSGADRMGVVVGAKLAKNIDAGVGEEILLVTSNRFNSLSYLGPLKIVGIFKTGVPEMDSSTVYVDRRLLAGEVFDDSGVEYTNEDAKVKNLDGIFTSVAIRAENMETLEQLRDQLNSKFPKDVRARTWQELVPWVSQTMDIRQKFGYVVLSIVLLIVVAGILNTVLMSVMERTREFGIMRALGTRRGQIFLTVSLESVFLGLAGIVIGLALGVIITLLSGHYGLDIYASIDEDLMGSFYMLESKVYPLLNLEHLFQTCATILIAVFVVSIYPAYKAARMEPVKAIKTLG